MIAVGNRMSFDEMSNLSVGDEFYEENYGKVIKAKVLFAPTVIDKDDIGNQVSFVAIAENGEEIDYLASEKFMYYSPKIYSPSEIHDISVNDKDA